MQFIQSICSTLYILNNFKPLPQSFYIAQSQKNLWFPARADSNPRRRPRLPSPPHLCPHYTTLGKNYPATEKFFGGGAKIIRLRKKCAAADNLTREGAGAPKNRKKISQCQKLSHSADNTLFHTLIHCETVPFPYTLPKTLSYYFAVLS